MNKKIYKGYELIEAIANGKIENYTKIIPHYPNDDCTAEYFEYVHGFIKVCYKDGCYRNSKYDNDVNVCIFLDNNRSFEILEDNTEEIEEIPQYRIDNCTDYNYCYLAEKYNKLAKAVNQIRKKKE